MMQKNFTKVFLFIFLFTLFEGKTQTAFPFPLENAVWTEVQHIFSNDTIIVHYGIIGDTLIKGRSYKKIFTSKDSAFKETNEDLSYFGALRTEGTKTLVLPKPRYAFDTTEYLVYDANFKIGDTLYYGIVNSEAGGSVIVNSIDSIQLLDNTIRKRWNFKRTYYRNNGTPTSQDCIFSWIEGIGNIKCPFNEPFICAFASRSADRLVSFEENNNQIYTDTQYQDCKLDDTVPTNEQVFTSQLNIFPNPTSGVILIQASQFNNSHQNLTIKIVNLAGKLIFNDRVGFNGIFELNIEQVPAGIYLIIIQDGLYIANQKLIKF
ncbi:MAG: T9SS type A sorting domain-containing protein [Sediminibacterium sp.]